MPYEPLSLEEFSRRLQIGRYTRLKTAKMAISAASWDEGVKARAFALTNAHFQVSVPGPAPVETPKSAGGPDEALEYLYRAIEAMPVLRARLASVLKFLESEQPLVPKPGVKKAPGRAAPSLEEGEVAPADITRMFDAPDDELEADPEEGPVTREPLHAVVGSDPAEVARACAERPDLENAIAEGDADAALDEKQKTALRVATGKLMEIRNKKRGN